MLHSVGLVMPRCPQSLVDWKALSAMEHDGMLAQLKFHFVWTVRPARDDHLCVSDCSFEQNVARGNEFFLEVVERILGEVRIERAAWLAHLGHQPHE